MTHDYTTVSITFHMTFTPEEVAVLTEAADHHYDSTCRAFEPLKLLAARQANGAPLDIDLRWHEFDILSKICESPLVPETIAHAVWSQFAALRAATQRASGV